MGWIGPPGSCLQIAGLDDQTASTASSGVHPEEGGSRLVAAQRTLPATATGPETGGVA